jgi:hypothetical protein
MIFFCRSFFPKAEKFDSEEFFKRIEDREKEDCIKNKVHDKRDPARNPDPDYDQGCKSISNDDGGKDAKKKYSPFFDHCAIHG